MIRERAASRYAFLIAGLALIATALRLVFLSRKSLWLDEAVTALEVSNLPRLFWACTHGQEPLYHLVVYGWVGIFGDGEFSLRAPSALFAIATVPLIAELARELSDRATGILSAILLTVHETHIQ